MAENKETKTKSNEVKAQKGSASEATKAKTEPKANVNAASKTKVEPKVPASGVTKVKPEPKAPASAGSKAKAESKESVKVAVKVAKTEPKTTEKVLKNDEKQLKNDQKTIKNEQKTIKNEPKTDKILNVKEVKTEKVAEIKAETKQVKKVSKVVSKEQVFLATGKRKKSIARIRMTVGSGKIVINNRDINDYFCLDTLITIAKQPLVFTKMEKAVDIQANIVGGGYNGQAGALRHGITRALILYNPDLRPELKKAGFLTRDARIKERKKYGLKKARKAPQFSKR